MASNNLSVQLGAILDEYSEEVSKVVDGAVKSVARQTAAKLKNSSPSKSGEYARGWSVKTVSRRESVVYNRTHPGLTHLLENGHVVRNKVGTYGRARAIKHIKPAEEWANAQFEAEIRRNL